MTARPICAGPARWMCHATALGHLCGYPQIDAPERKTSPVGTGGGVGVDSAPTTSTTKAER